MRLEKRGDITDPERLMFENDIVENKTNVHTMATDAEASTG